MTSLTAWESFYVIVGSSAGALTGLQFVTMALIAEMPVNQGTVQASDAFSTPTIVHFGAVLLLSAILSAPWPGFVTPLALCGVCGALGLGFIIIPRMRRQSAYIPVFEDWLFHVILPVVAYGVLGAATLAARSHPDMALFGVATASLLLLFIGIHNA
jgi:hypothetical protein